MSSIDAHASYERGTKPPDNWSYGALTREQWAAELRHMFETRTLGDLAIIFGVSSYTVLTWLKTPYTMPKWAGQKMAEVLKMNRAKQKLAAAKKVKQSKKEIHTKVTEAEYKKIKGLATQNGIFVSEFLKLAIDTFIEELEEK